MPKLILLPLVLFALLCTSCQAPKPYEWDHGNYADTAFSSAVPGEIEASFEGLREQLGDLPEEDNRIVVDECRYFTTGENSGYVYKTYRHVQANAARAYEIYAFDRDEYTLIDGSTELCFYAAICDGEYLYYAASDGVLRRIDIGGETVFLGEFPPAEYLSLAAEGNVITVTTHFDDSWEIVL